LRSCGDENDDDDDDNDDDDDGDAADASIESRGRNAFVSPPPPPPVVELPRLPSAFPKLANGDERIGDFNFDGVSVMSL
jgi:hypothetical protein